MLPDNVVELRPAAAALPCPFCGGPDPDFEFSSEAQEDCWIYCDNCRAQGPVATIGCRTDDDGEFDLVEEATELWNKRVGCAMGLACPEHRDSVHGAEAEELRQAMQKMADELVNEDGDMPEVLRDRIIETLDRVDARDSLAFLECQKGAAVPQ